MAYDPNAPIVKREPALTVGVVVAVIVTLLNVFGVVLDEDTLGTVVQAVAVLAGSVVIRQNVTPVD